jgi:peptidoglycan/xylan/chitin deacetylase (PgdA/CDA1 family)
MARTIKWALRALPMVAAIFLSMWIMSTPWPLWLKGVGLMPCVFFLLVSLEFYLPNFFVLTPRFPCRLDDRSKILLTFDDGPHPDITPQVLDVLKQLNVRACFFCIQENAQMHPAIIQRIIAEGHSLGSHSTHHENLPLKSNQAVLDELAQGIAYYQNHHQYELKYFRYPRGRKSFWTQMAIQKTGLQVLGFSYPMFDVENPPVETLLKRARKKIKGGDILLFHDGYQKDFHHQHRSSMIQALPEIIEYARRQSLSFISLD